MSWKLGMVHYVSAATDITCIWTRAGWNGIPKHEFRVMRPLLNAVDEVEEVLFA